MQTELYGILVKKIQLDFHQLIICIRSNCSLRTIKIAEKRKRKKKKSLKISESYKGSQDLWTQNPREKGRAESTVSGTASLSRHL